MSNAGEEKNPEGEQNSNSKPIDGDYSRAVAKVAVAQVCEGVSFEGVKESALEALSDIAIRYICDLGKSAKQYSGLAGRSECNVFDIVKGLEDLTSTRGFQNASEADCCAIDSGALKEILDFVATAEEIPFAHAIPHFPVSKTETGSQSFLKLGEKPRGNHIPEWLPPFPEPHTYQKSAVLNLSKEKAQVVTEEAVQRRQAEDALLNLENRLATCAAAEANAPEVNPFLAPPLSAGEKEVSQITIPSSLVSIEGNKKHGPLVETFASAIDSVMCREPDSMDVDKGLSLEKRPVVQFRLKSKKKTLSENVDVGLRSKGGEGRVPALNLDERRNAKKRKAEEILKQSMMNSQVAPENAK